jgi:microsomal dipeptidase-like Zn-dependent dipeptidase
MQKPLVFDGLQISNWDRETIEEIKRGDIHGIHATLAVWETPIEAIRNIADWNVLRNENSDLIEIATSSDDIRNSAEQGKVSVVLGFQNTSPFAQDYTLVEIFHQLGIRIAQLTYNIQNYVGGSCYDPEDSGLTRFGTRIVEEMNRVGMLIDLSHVGNKTSLNAIEASSKPVSITHANPLWFANTPRNKPDEVIQALVDRGGVIGACLYPNVIGGQTTSQTEFSSMVVKLVDQYGPEHVAIGSDMTRNWDKGYVNYLRDGRWKPAANASWPEWPAWFNSPEDFPKLAAGLLDAGLSENDLGLVMGENWLRLFETTFTPSGELEGVATTNG